MKLLQHGGNPSLLEDRITAIVEWLAKRFAKKRIWDWHGRCKLCGRPKDDE